MLFDFDGTITKKDSLLEFLLFYHGSLRVLSGLILLSPVLALYVLQIISNEYAKQIVFRWFFKNADTDEYNKRCSEFSITLLPGLVREQALEEIKMHQNNNATLAVVTASAENWVKPWCDAHELLCIGTRLEVVNNKLTGMIKGRNCSGVQKSIRIKEVFNLDDYDEIIAYGDSKGDREMLALADQPFYRRFKGAT